MRYDDVNEENIDLRNETWCSSSSPVASALTAMLTSLKSNAQDYLALYLDTFGNKAFLRHEAQGLQSYVLHTA